MAMELARSGGLSPLDPVLGAINDPAVLEAYRGGNYQPTIFLPGVYTTADGLEFQFYHLFPVWLALLGDVFAPQGSSYGLTLLSLVSLLFFQRLAHLISGRASVGLVAGLLLAVNPLHAFFSKFTVTEVPTLAFSTISFVFLLSYWRSSSSQRHGRQLIVSALALGLLFMTRISGFMYLPFVFAVSAAVAIFDPDHGRRRGLLAWSAGQLRSQFFRSLRPDVLLVTSFFETGTCYTTALDWNLLRGIRTAVIAYDLIPLIFPERYLPEGHFVTEWYRRRLDDLRNFDLHLAISEATRQDLIRHLDIPEDKIRVIGAGFDSSLLNHADAEGAETALAVAGIDRPYVLMVGNGDWRKNTMGALQAFAGLSDEARRERLLVLTQVGEDVRAALAREYKHVASDGRTLGKVDEATLAALYRHCEVFYFPSIYEGFGLPVLEAMAMGAATLSSNLGSLPEVVHDARMLFDPRDRRASTLLLEKALMDDVFRMELQSGAKEHALGFTWRRTAQLALDALHRLEPQDMTPLGHMWPSEPELDTLVAACVAAGHQGDAMLEHGLEAIERGQVRRVLVDITEIIRLDARSGVQRVTRNFLVGLERHASQAGGFTVEPFQWTKHGIVGAREYARAHLGMQFEGEDEPVASLPGDLVFMLDSSWWSPERFDGLHHSTWEAGGEVVWMVHDLIPMLHPETCDPVMPPVFRTWLTHAVRTADGFICNSEATRRDLVDFIEEVLPATALRPWARFVHLGCDLDLVSAVGSNVLADSVMESLGIERTFFVALGTLEPRKDYSTILDAFERLWSTGTDVGLVLIGKRGWNIDALTLRVEGHAELGRRLFWLEGASDADIRKLLRGSRALIQASVAEGFGLPIVEASMLGVPVILSDIPVFREIAGSAASYFSVGDARALAATVKVVSDGGAVSSLGIRCRSWAEASRELCEVLLDV